MRGNLFGIAENTSTKPTTTSKQATTTRATTRSKQAANTPPPNEKQQANGGRSRNRGRGRGRGGGGEHAVLQTQPRQPTERETGNWDEAFAQMQAEFEKEMAPKNPAEEWGETPKEKLKRQLIEQWRVNVVPGASTS